MTFNPKLAAEFIAAELATGTLTHEDLARIVHGYQRVRGLDADGRPGPATLGSLNRPRPLAKVYPLRVLSDLRKPNITSQFKSRNPSRPGHDGVDLFYRYLPSRDPQTKCGDGCAARGPDGQPKWWIPANEPAIAAAAGKVQSAENSRTGWRVWIEHSDGMRTGYFHLRNVRVISGQVVALGAPLGEVGDNPIELDAEHLHFEVSPIDRYDPIDPELWLAGAVYHMVPF